MQECHKVFSEVGLIIRAEASSESRKVGRLAKGAKVKLAGEVLKDTGAVYPEIQVDDAGAYWIRIKAPQRGYVLYGSKDDPEYSYIVPCE